MESLKFSDKNHPYPLKFSDNTTTTTDPYAYLHNLPSFDHESQHPLEQHPLGSEKQAKFNNNDAIAAQEAQKQNHQVMASSSRTGSHHHQHQAYQHLHSHQNHNRAQALQLGWPSAEYNIVLNIRAQSSAVYGGQYNDTDTNNNDVVWTDILNNQNDISSKRFMKVILAKDDSKKIRDPLIDPLLATSDSGDSIQKFQDDEQITRDKQTTEKQPLKAPLGGLYNSDITVLFEDGQKESSSSVFTICSTRVEFLPDFYLSATCIQPHDQVSPLPLEHLNVKRTVSDFLWLQQRLKLRYDGYIVPPLPVMTLAGRMKYGYNYIHERRKGLEAFLKKISVHPMLSKTEEFIDFLGLNGESSWKYIRSTRVGQLPNKDTDSISTDTSEEPRKEGAPSENNPLRPQFESFHQWADFNLWRAARIINRQLASVLVRRSERDDIEDRLLKLNQYTESLAHSLEFLTKALEMSNRKITEQSAVATTLVTSLESLGHLEGGKFEALMNESATVLEKEFVIQKKLNGQNRVPESEYGLLEETTKDLSYRAKGLQRVMSRRIEEKEFYEHALEKYNKLRDSLDSQLVGSDYIQAFHTVTSIGGDESGLTSYSGMDRVQKLHTQVAEAASSLAKARKMYENVSESTNSELNRLKNDMSSCIPRILKELAETNMKYHAAQAEKWRTLATQCESYSMDRDD